VLENIGLVRALIDLALEEDIGAGDVTTKSIVSAGLKAAGLIVAKKEGVIAGLPVAKAVFERVGPGVVFYPELRDGTSVREGQTLARIEGDAGTILTGERLALNFLQRLSGIATYTNRLVGLIQGYKAKIVDTRKTSPGARILEKYAVRMGGGGNHRFGLYDAALIKDNHLQVAGSITRAIQLARAAIPFTMKVEVDTEILEANVRRVLAERSYLEQLKAANTRESELLKKITMLEEENRRIKGTPELRQKFKDSTRGLIALDKLQRALFNKDSALRSYERNRSLYESGLYSRHDYEQSKAQYEKALKELQEAQSAAQSAGVF